MFVFNHRASKTSEHGHLRDSEKKDRVSSGVDSMFVLLGKRLQGGRSNGKAKSSVPSSVALIFFLLQRGCWFVQDLIRFVHVRGAVRRFYLSLENDLSCGQTYFTSEGKLYSCSEVCRILSRIFGGNRSMVGIPEQLAKALVYPVHLTEIVGEVKILRGI